MIVSVCHVFIKEMNDLSFIHLLHSFISVQNQQCGSLPTLLDHTETDNTQSPHEKKTKNSQDLKLGLSMQLNLPIKVAKQIAS